MFITYFRSRLVIISRPSAFQLFTLLSSMANFYFYFFYRLVTTVIRLAILSRN